MDAFLANDTIAGCDRWKLIDLGMIQTLLHALWKNISVKTSATVSILTTVLISLCDTISDFSIAIALFLSGNKTWGCVILILDYVPSWTLAAHNCSSKRWRNIECAKEKLLTIGFLLISPFCTALFNLRWLFEFESARFDDFNYLHHNARLSQLLSSSFESPIQIVSLLVLYGNGKLALPWDQENVLIDSQGRKVYLGLLSLVISIISLMKGSLDISEGKKWYDRIHTLVYAICNYLYRLPSLALAIMYYNEWSTMLFMLIILANWITIVRYTADKRKEFSLITSVLVTSMSPFVLSDQANVCQRKDNEHSRLDRYAGNRNRKHLSANTSMVVSGLLFLSNVTLLCQLKFNEGFKYSESIVMDTEETEQFLGMFLLPLGGLLAVSNYLYRVVLGQRENPYHHYFGLDYIYFLVAESILTKIKSWFQHLGHILILCCVLTVGITSIAKIIGNSPLTLEGK